VDKVVCREVAKSLEFHIRNGETYKNSPVVAFEILQAGETAHAVLKRSSGLPEVDDHALKSVRELKFNNRPGCGVIESSMAITIDFR
jgi:TonB family protein